MMIRSCINSGFKLSASRMLLNNNIVGNTLNQHHSYSTTSTTNTTTTTTSSGVTSDTVTTNIKKEKKTTTTTKKSTTKRVTNNENYIAPRKVTTTINTKISTTNAVQNVAAPDSKLFKGEVLLEGIKHDGTSLRWYNHVGYTYDYEKKGFTPLIDNRAMKTPVGNHFVVPTKELATAIAAEWWTQGKYIKPSRLPLTSTSATCIDLSPENRTKSINEIIGHIATDPVFNREKDTDSTLRRLQDEKFNPIMEWAARYYNAEFTISYDLKVSKNTKPLLKRIQDHLESMSNWQLMALQCVVTSSKSYFLALATYYGLVKLDAVYAHVALEEEFQSDIWGKIPFGHDLAECETLNEIAPALFILRSIDPLPLPVTNRKLKSKSESKQEVIKKDLKK